MNQTSYWVLPYFCLRYWSFQTLEYGFRKSDGTSPPRSAKNTPPPSRPAPGEKIEGILWTAGRVQTYKVNSVKYKKTNVNMTAKPRGSTVNRKRNSDTHVGHNQGQRWCQNAPTSRTDTQFYVHVKNCFKR